VASETKTASIIERLKPPTGPKSDKKPTKEQQVILVEAGKVKKCLIIEAGAGTGKTTTLRMLADVMEGRGQYTAFNSALVAETKPKFHGTRVQCNTTHSLAFQAVGKQYAHKLNRPRIKSEQVARMLELEAFEFELGDETRRIAPGFLAGKVLDAIRRFCQSADMELTVDHFRYIDGIDAPVDERRTYTNNKKVREYLLPFALKAWKDLCDKDGELTFGHDHYVKIWQLSDPVISADYILLDEAQDTAPVMLDILRRQKCPVILVGDSAQQIYEWRGAINAMSFFPDAPRCFLSQSFRFGEAIAQVANAVLETLDEPTPLRLKGLPSIPSVVGPIEKPTAILCRTNAMAVTKLLTAIGNGLRPFLVGGGSDVISFVEAAECLQKLKPTSHPELACFASWTEVQEYSKQDEGEDLRLMVKLIDTFGAKVIKDALKNMPQEKDADLIISTAHKAKGREWDTVALASDFPTLSKCDDAIKKLVYVAVTRAKLQLDITECPTFTGDDSLDVEYIIASTPIPAEIPTVIPPTPSSPPEGEFTWSMDKVTGKWVVRGPSGRMGQYVDVVRKDGSVSRKFLVSVITEDGEISRYKV
jgi:hypothetical protein